MRRVQSLWGHALVMALGLLIAPTAEAHIVMNDPPERHPDEPLALDFAPCGKQGSTPGSVRSSYAPGETITVEFEVAVNHTPPTGKYRIAIDDDGQDFPLPDDPAAVERLPLAIDFEFDDTGNMVAEITLPNSTCDHCTLQLLQYKTPAEASGSEEDYYYRCADIRIEGAPVEGGSGGSGAAPEPNGSGGRNATGGSGGGPTAVDAAVGGDGGSEASGGAPSMGGTGEARGADAGVAPAAGSSGDAGGCATTRRAGPGRLGATLLLVSMVWAGRRRRQAGPIAGLDSSRSRR